MADDPIYDVSGLTGLDSGGSPLSGGAVQPPMAPPPDPSAPETTNMPISGSLQPPAPTSPVSVQSLPPAPPAGQQSVWKTLVQGALWGLAGSAGATTFGGGAAGGAQGVLKQKQLQFENQQAQQRQDSDIKFQTLQAAHLAAQTTKLAKEAASWDEDHQTALFDRNIDASEKLKNLGLNPEYATANDSDSEMAALKDATAKNGGVAPYLSLQVGKNQFLHFNLNQAAASDAGQKAINDHQQRLGQPAIDDATWAKLPPQQKIAAIHDAATAWQPTNDPNKLADMKNDLALVQNLPEDAGYKRADSISSLQKSIKASEDLVKNNRPVSIEDRVKESQINKNNAEADKARREGDEGTDWLPKTTANQKTKADLADNIAENAATIKGILARRPDIVGAVNGRISQGKTLVGTNDGDLTALDTAVSNLAKANASVHGLKSHEGIVDTENKILNSFKNGTNGIIGALDATTDSVQTFVDSSRPATSPKHSSNGGVRSFYEKQKGAGNMQSAQPVYASAPGKPRVMSTDGGKTWQPAPAQ